VTLTPVVDLTQPLEVIDLTDAGETLDGLEVLDALRGCWPTNPPSETGGPSSTRANVLQKVLAQAGIGSRRVCEDLHRRGSHHGPTARWPCSVVGSTPSTT